MLKPNAILLTSHEMQSGLDRVRYAENLIEQLPKDHDGRNTWLAWYGRDKQAHPLVRAFIWHPITVFNQEESFKDIYVVRGHLYGDPDREFWFSLAQYYMGTWMTYDPDGAAEPLYTPTHFMPLEDPV